MHANCKLANYAYTQCNWKDHAYWYHPPYSYLTQSCTCLKMQRTLWHYITNIIMGPTSFWNLDQSYAIVDYFRLFCSLAELNHNMVGKTTEIRCTHACKQNVVHSSKMYSNVADPILCICTCMSQDWIWHSIPVANVIRFYFTLI